MKTINKKLPKRFTEAVTKLYNAFHNGTLNAFDCSACAVGNIVGHGDWSMNEVDDSQDVCLIKQLPPRFFYPPNHIDYSNEELYQVESIFLNEHVNNNLSKKEQQFNGLCKVVEYLCELDNIPNILDYTSLFETNEKSEPKKQLQFA